jgi:hypothetical protein
MYEGIDEDEYPLEFLAIWFLLLVVAVHGYCWAGCTLPPDH